MILRIRLGWIQHLPEGIICMKIGVTRVTTKSVAGYQHDKARNEIVPSGMGMKVTQS